MWRRNRRCNEMNKKPKQPVLETARLRLLPFKAEDAKTVQLLAGNENIANKTLNIPHPYRDGVAEQWISSHRQAWREKQALTCAIFLKSSKQLIGAVGLPEIHDDQAHLGYWIGEAYWNCGYCTEAARALLEFAFNELKLNLIRAEHLTSNPASGRVMQKLGMCYQSTHAIKDRNGRRAEVNVYQINRDKQ